MILRGSLSDGAARAVDALMWGWWSYRAFHEDVPLDEHIVRSAYAALVSIPTVDPSAQQEAHHA